MRITVISYPLHEINYTIEAEKSYYSNKIVKYLWVNIAEAVSDEYVEISYNGVVKTLLITDECRYTPIDIAFQNKEGAIQLFTFFKAKKDTITTTSENFESNRPIGSHQFIKYNVNAKTKFTVNSGFITEDKNEAIRQLLLSERVWMLSGDTAIPLNVSTSSQEFKNRQNDRLINYAIEFEHAYYENNNI
ncbi:hypothetical protein HYN59_07210 [Flavobacterium album]|uniref:Uncharacterized protein n=1 Tax=Flavobacterium album TaxID=2175091 RepID=A0A2S1QWY6_9FLAO|nr:hypothetical protein [Flavobacterium album]AWH84927.1 hypothetical protein HYN59_07210 [Flavobacterium album]